MSERRKKGLSFVDKVPEKCVCANCHGVQLDIIKLKNCEHTMCETCISKRMRHGLVCCPCSAIIEEGLEEETTNLRNTLKELRILCPKLCGQTIRAGQFSTHVDHECPLTKVICHYKGCQQKMKRKDLSIHVKLCDFRTVTCEGCKRNLKFIELRKHQITMGCVNQKLKQIIVRQLRGSDKELKQYITNIKQDTFKSMRDERTLEKEYMRRRVERNPDGFSPTLVQRSQSENHLVEVKGVRKGRNGYSSVPSNVLSDDTGNRKSPMLIRSRERQLRSAEPQVCRRCWKTYTSRGNHDEACLWHKGVSS